MNRDRGVQFTSLEYTQAFKDARGAVSMDGKGRWMDNLMIERIWRSVKWGVSICGKWIQAANPIKYLESGFSSITCSARIQLLTAVG